MIQIDGNHLTLKELSQIAYHHEIVTIDPQALLAVEKAEAFVETIVEGTDAVYGVNTGFGKLSDVRINKCDLETLQKNLLMSHACAVGDVLPIPTVRAMMVLRLNALIKGHSGVRKVTVMKLLEYLNADLIPVVFEKGSLGASGDLAPLAHMSLPLIGLGELFYQGERMPAKEALKKAAIEPLSGLKAKEGLSLINGTQAMNAVGALVLSEALKLLDLANLSLALSLEALEGIEDAFYDRVHQLRNQPGQINVAQSVLACIKNSKNITHQADKRVQDAYSLRCSPQVHGAVSDTLSFVSDVVNREMNAVTDNPVLFVDSAEAISAGHFHGEPLALAFDYLGIAISELANISERRIERMVNPALSNGLPAFLVNNGGLNNGLMIVQYTAAMLVSENKVLAHPASVDSIPSSANQEDHVSMGSISALKARTILSNVQKVIAYEMFTALQAIDIRKSADKLGDRTKKAYNYLRQSIPFIEHDTVMYPYLHSIESIVTSEAFYDAMYQED